jgi:membrane protein implicated in regulation of membrane protease activity
MLLLIGFVLLLVLDSPWNWIAFFVCVILFTFEITFFWRRVRGRRVQAGSETLIGKQAKVVAACRPLGQVVVDGERWEARCADGAGTGETVTIVSRDGLVLVVEKSVRNGDLERHDD